MHFEADIYLTTYIIQYLKLVMYEKSLEATVFGVAPDTSGGEPWRRVCNE